MKWHYTAFHWFDKVFGLLGDSLATGGYGDSFPLSPAEDILGDSEPSTSKKSGASRKKTFRHTINEDDTDHDDSPFSNNDILVSQRRGQRAASAFEDNSTS